MSFPPSARPLRRRIGWLPLLVLVGSIVLGTGVGFAVHRVRGMTAVPSASDSGSTAPGGPSTPVVTTSTVPTASSSPSPDPTASSAAPDLPRGTALADDQFVVPRGGTNAQGLYVARTKGPAAPRRLRTPAGHHVNSPTLSVDRRTIIYIDRTSDRVRVIGADGTGDRVLFAEHPGGCGTIGHVSWNRADQNILVLRCRTDSDRSRLLVIDLEGELIRRLDTGNRKLDDPAISPDGTQVAFWMSNSSGSTNGGAIATMPLDGSAEPSPLTDDRPGRDADPAWSPDGSRLAFRRSVSKNFEVYVMAADGTGAKRVVGGPATEEKPAWSPDGSLLMVVSNRTASGGDGGDEDLYLAAANGKGDPEPLGLGAEVVTTPVWVSR